jgi:tryptophanyl-tRNA synthetase
VRIPARVINCSHSLKPGVAVKIMNEPKKRVFSGIQPTGKIHIGNYSGAMSIWVRHQADYDNLFCVVDLHAVTIPESLDPQQFRDKTMQVVALYLACGIDPPESTIYLQSHVPEHSELAWLLTCLTPLGWLNRMTQFKAKSSRSDTIGTGLLCYPVLMAADILLYDTDLVPVGEDQKQHIEFARDLAQRCNTMFATHLKLPEPLIRKSGARIMGLDNPEEKMSKSIGAVKQGHAIGLLDTPAEIKSAIMKSVTDSRNDLRFDHAGAGALNLLTLYEVLSGQPRHAIEAQFHGGGYGRLKKALVELVIETLQPIQQEYGRYMDAKDYLAQVLSEGAQKARSIASPNIAALRQALGFIKA